MTSIAPWGIGRYIDESGDAQLLTMSVTDVDIEAAVAKQRLSDWGFGADDIVLVIAGVAEAVQFAPFQRAARSLGGISCTAEPSVFDAARAAAFLEQYELRAVIGLDAALLSGLEHRDDVTSLLGRCPNLLVRSDALSQVASLGLNPAGLHILGPTVALECPARAGAHVGAHGWKVGSDAQGRVWVEPAAGRQLSIGRVVTNVRGAVIDEQCSCGSNDPRVVVE